MPYLNFKAYSPPRPILYNNCNTYNLYGAYIEPSKISYVGGHRRIVEGSFLTASHRLLNRAKVISPYTKKGKEVIVNNPWAFLPGDVLYQIGDETEQKVAEANAVNGGTAQEFGTVTAVDAGVNPQVTTVTPSGVVPGDVFSLKIEEIEASFTATTTNVDEVTKGLYEAFMVNLAQSHHSSLEYLTLEDAGTSLTLTANAPGNIFITTGSVDGTGTLDISVTTGVGTLTISPNGGNSNLNIGAKIGGIDETPLGIIANPAYLTNEDNLDRLADLAAYDQANVFKKSLPYLDGQLVAAMPTLKFAPAYGI